MTNPPHYLIKIKRLSFLEAVEQITGQAANQPPVFLSASNEVKREPLLLPHRDCNQSMLERYLRKRGISYEVIHYFLDHNLIYQNYHQGFYNLVFIGKDPQNVPRYASIRGISSDFKGDVTGSDKRYSFSYSCPDSEHMEKFKKEFYNPEKIKHIDGKTLVVKVIEQNSKRDTQER